VAAVERLLTFVDLDAHDPGPDARSNWMSARLDAVLAEGRQIVLLDDRGWGGTLSWAGEPSEEELRQFESLSAWSFETVEQLEREARSVVGPDDEDEAAYWNWLAEKLQRKGIDVGGDELSRLPHDVELSDRVLARIGPRS